MDSDAELCIGCFSCWYKSRSHQTAFAEEANIKTVWSFFLTAHTTWVTTSEDGYDEATNQEDEGVCPWASGNWELKSLWYHARSM
jgi:hypothetical protein